MNYHHHKPLGSDFPRQWWGSPKLLKLSADTAVDTMDVEQGQSTQEAVEDASIREKRASSASPQKPQEFTESNSGDRDCLFLCISQSTSCAETWFCRVMWIFCLHLYWRSRNRRLGSLQDIKWQRQTMQTWSHLGNVCPFQAEISPAAGLEATCKTRCWGTPRKSRGLAFWASNSCPSAHRLPQGWCIAGFRGTVPEGLGEVGGSASKKEQAKQIDRKNIRRKM